MNKRHHPPKPSNLEKKLASYALAGVAAVAAPAVAKADIIYVPVNQTFTQMGANSYDFNLSGPSSDDITVTANTEFGYDEIVASTGTGAQFVGTSTNHVAALAFGDLIGSSSTYIDGGKMASAYLLEPGGWDLAGGTAYMGFYFGGATSPQYGWADISEAGDNSFTVVGYAYETDPNTAITAGEGAPTPEPSSLPLLVLGAAGLIAWRRRRAANA